MFAMLEGATGVFFVAVLISRLVSLYTAERGAELGREAQGDDSPVPPNEGPGGPDR